MQTCTKCQGHWLNVHAYWNWRNTLQGELPNLKAEDGGVDMDHVDSDAGKRCPADGAFLIRHQVGHSLNFHLDRCGRCGGVWLDDGEWEALQKRQMHDDLHLIFTSSWQAEVRRQRRAMGDERMLIKRLGEKNYRKAKETRDWIAEVGNGRGDGVGELLANFLSGIFDSITDMSSDSFDSFDGDVL